MLQHPAQQIKQFTGFSLSAFIGGHVREGAGALVQTYQTATTLLKYGMVYSREAILEPSLLDKHENHPVVYYESLEERILDAVRAGLKGIAVDFKLSQGYLGTSFKDAAGMSVWRNRHSESLQSRQGNHRQVERNDMILVSFLFFLHFVGFYRVFFRLCSPGSRKMGLNSSANRLGKR